MKNIEAGLWLLAVVSLTLHAFLGVPMYIVQIFFSLLAFFYLVFSYFLLNDLIPFQSKDILTEKKPTILTGETIALGFIYYAICSTILVMIANYDPSVAALVYFTLTLTVVMLFMKKRTEDDPKYATYVRLRKKNRFFILISILSFIIAIYFKISMVE